MAGEMSREEFLQSLLKDMPEKELEKLAQSSQAVFQAAAKAANDGNHTYDSLGDSSEHIARAAEAILNQQRKQS